jgi:type III secretion system-like peptide-binding chaperone
VGHLPSDPATPAATSGSVSLADHVEAILKSAFGWPKVIRDGDGDIPVRNGSALYFIRVIDDPDLPRVMLFAPLVSDVKASPELYETLNAVNVRLSFARVMHTTNDEVMLAADLPARTLEADELMAVVEMFSGAADGLDTQFKGQFGGTTRFDDDADAVEV